MINSFPENSDRTYSGVPIPSSVSTEVDHFLRHIGKAFMVSDTITVTASSTYYFFFKVDTGKEVHLWSYAFTSTKAEADLIMFEGSTVTANGTAVSFRNENRNAPDTFAGTFYMGSTVTVDGTQLQHNLISGSKTTGGSAKGDEIVLKANTNYVLKYVNNSGQDDKISFDIVFLDIV